MTRKQKRLTTIGVLGLVISLAVGLATVALRDEIVFFYEPSEILANTDFEPGQRFRLGGLVQEGSVDKNDTTVSFSVTDMEHTIPVTYKGILPDLFREGQGVIAEGILQPDGSFAASNVLAKHDENYVPKELEDLMERKQASEVPAS